jgi:hypothetical protein
MATKSRIAAIVAAVVVAVALPAAAIVVLRDDAASGEHDLTPSKRVRVEVLNAAGRAGLAREATRRLRARGFDVVYFGNAEEFGQDSSVVLDRVGDLRTARSVAGALGIRSVASEPDSSRLLDVTVILGLDWPPPERSTAPGLGERIRSLLRRARGASVDE